MNEKACNSRALSVHSRRGGRSGPTAFLVSWTPPSGWVETTRTQCSRVALCTVGFEGVTRSSVGLLTVGACRTCSCRCRRAARFRLLRACCCCCYILCLLVAFIPCCHRIAVCTVCNVAPAPLPPHGGVCTDAVHFLHCAACRRLDLLCEICNLLACAWSGCCCVRFCSVFMLCCAIALLLLHPCASALLHWRLRCFCCAVSFWLLLCVGILFYRCFFRADLFHFLCTPLRCRPAKKFVAFCQHE